MEPVCANIPSCPSIPLPPNKLNPLPIKEPLKVEPLTEVALVKSTILGSYYQNQYLLHFQQ